MSEILSHPFMCFVVYPSKPTEIDITITAALGRANAQSSVTRFTPWVENDVAGRPILDPINHNISNSKFIVADVSVLNFNVSYEIGLAIGQRKRALSDKAQGDCMG